METITKDNKMTFKEFLDKKPKAVSKKKFAEMIGCNNINTGFSVIFFDWKNDEGVI